jgi:nitrate/nitrite transport system substrate-binding protein
MPDCINDVRHDGGDKDGGRSPDVARSTNPSPYSTRRQWLQALGGAGLFCAVSPAINRQAERAFAAGDPDTLEKPNLIIGITQTIDSAPLIIAEQRGLFKKYGFESVALVQSDSLQMIADQQRQGAFDLGQQLMPVSLLPAISARPSDDLTVVIAVLNQNGCSLAMALKHKDNKDPKRWSRMRFGVPHAASIHALLLRYYLAEHGLDPDQDVSLRVVPQGQFLAHLRAGILDGVMCSEPMGQQIVYEGVGYIHTASSNIWQGHPCGVLVAQSAWMKRFPKTLLAVQKAVFEASAFLSKKQSFGDVVPTLGKPDYLNMPDVVLEPVLRGDFADGLGDTISAPNRTAFVPFPHPSATIWTLTQLKRWGMIRGDIKYAEIAKRAVQQFDDDKFAASLSLSKPATNRVDMIMGRPFDADKPDEYIAGFKIRRS